jgi:hypothetical protein
MAIQPDYKEWCASLINQKITLPRRKSLTQMQFSKAPRRLLLRALFIPFVMTVRAAPAAEPARDTIRFECPADTRVSLAVYDREGVLIRELLRAVPLKAGAHEMIWDGLDREGKPVPEGTYPWRLLETAGFRSRFVTALGVNPGSGYKPHFARSWVGDHTGAGTVCVDGTGVYIGSMLTEGLMQTLKQSHDGKTRHWEQPQYYDGGQMTRMAAGGGHVWLVQKNGNLRKLDASSGRQVALWKIAWEKEPAADVDAHDGALVVCYPKHGAVRWLDPGSGAAQQTAEGIPGCRALSVRGDGAGGEVVVLGDGGVFTVSRSRPKPVRRIDGANHDFAALDVDHATGDLYVIDARDGVRVRRYDREYKLVKSYGGAKRPWGRYDPQLFSGPTDVAADGRGGFYVTEPTAPPRRTAHFDAGTGRLLREWYGGQSFYVNAAVDPDDPADVWGCAGEGFIHHYRMDYDAGTWSIRAVYAIGRLEDSLFPFTGKWLPRRHRGRLHLLHANLPAMVRVDEENGRVIPVAIAGYAHRGRRSFLMFPGSGEKGFAKPWVAAARHHGHEDLAKAPTYYAWADADGNGRMDPAEFRLFEKHADARPGGMGWYDRDFNVFKSATAPGNPVPFYRLPRTGWTGPDGGIPVWRWDRAEPAGRVPEITTDWPSIRALVVLDDGSIVAPIQSGIMIRGHGQYEGGRWPYEGLKRARLAKWSKDGRLLFSVSRHSKTPDEVHTGVLYYPMQIVRGPRGTVVVGDQVHQPAVVWTADGLYAGAFLDRRADDGRKDGFYRAHSDDMQGVELAVLGDGRVFWFQSVQGMVLVYEVTGWDGLKRRAGEVRRPAAAKAARHGGTGLSATYYADADAKAVAFRATEAPLYFNPFGKPPHPTMPKAPHAVAWEGFLEPAHTDAYRFVTMLGKDEEATVRIDGEVVHASGKGKVTGRPAPLTAGRRHRIRIDYVNREGRAELKVLWSGTLLDRRALAKEELYPLP